MLAKEKIQILVAGRRHVNCFILTIFITDLCCYYVGRLEKPPHIVCDSKSKFIIQYEVTPANVHDSQELINLIPPTVTNEEPFYADAAYDSRAIHKELLERGFIPRIIKSARRFRSLTAEDREENRKKSSTRCRIEHVFGDIKNRRNGLRIMTIGLARAKTKPGLINLVYNMRRYQTITTRCLQI